MSRIPRFDFPRSLPIKPGELTPAIWHALHEIADDVGMFLGKPYSAAWLSAEQAMGFGTWVLAPIAIAELSGISDAGYILRLGSRTFWFSPTSWGLFAVKIAAVVSTKHLSVLLTSFLFSGDSQRDLKGEWLSNWDLVSALNPFNDMTDRRRFAALTTDAVLGSIIAYEIVHHYAHIQEIVKDARTLFTWLNGAPFNTQTGGLLNSIYIQKLARIPIRELFGRNRAAVAEVVRIVNAWKRVGLWGNPQVVAALQRFLVIDSGMKWPSALYRLKFLVQRLGMPVVGNPVFQTAVALPVQLGLKIPVATLVPPPLPTTPLTIVAPLTQAERNLSRLRRLAALDAGFAARNAGNIAALEAEVIAADAEFTRLWRLARTPATASELSAMAPAAIPAAASPGRVMGTVYVMGQPGYVPGQPLLPGDVVFGAPHPAITRARSLFRGLGNLLSGVGRFGMGALRVVGTAAIPLEAYSIVGENLSRARFMDDYLREVPGLTPQQQELRRAIMVARDNSENMPYAARVFSGMRAAGGNRPGLSLSPNQQGTGTGGLTREEAIARDLRDRQVMQLQGSPYLLTAAAIALGLEGLGVVMGGIVNEWATDINTWNSMRRFGGGQPDMSEWPPLSQLLGDHRSGPLRPGNSQLDNALSAQLDANLQAIAQQESAQRRVTQPRQSAGRWFRATPPYLAMLPNLEAMWDRALAYVEASLQSMISLQFSSASTSGGGRSTSVPYEGGTGRNFWLYRGRDRDLMLQTLRDVVAIVERDTFAESGKKTAKLSTRELIFPSSVPWLSTAVMKVIDALSYDATLVRSRGPLGGFYSLNEAG